MSVRVTVYYKKFKSFSYGHKTIRLKPESIFKNPKTPVDEVPIDDDDAVLLQSVQPALQLLNRVVY